MYSIAVRNLTTVNAFVVFNANTALTNFSQL